MSAKLKTVLIIGAGGVLGAAVAKEFSGAGYNVIGIRRDSSRAANIADASTNQIDINTAQHERVSELIANNVSYRVHHCDFLDRQSMQQAVDQIVAEYGAIDVLIFNAAHLVMAPFLELTKDDFTASWNASVGSAVVAAQAVLPSMLKQQQGVMVFSGATAAIRGTARFAAFAAAKFALRGLTQALAREYQSQGIHVAHVVIDGLVSGSPSVAKFGGSEECSIDPAAVASTYRCLAEQPSSAWTLEMDVRPSSERF
jgi:NAD(P)-dependent dehydrogenase (short-subunit alcohol dehydrogenase family)